MTYCLRLPARKLLVVVVAAVAGLIAGCGSPKPVSAPTTPVTPAAPLATAPSTTSVPTSASDLLVQVNRDAIQSGWAHMDLVGSQAGHSSVFSSDAGPTTGRQVITVDQEHATVVLIAGTAYIKGDAAAVTDFFGFPASQVSRLANHWIALTTADTGYTTVSDGVTLSSALSQVALTAPLSEGAAIRLDGVQVVGITGQLPTTPNSPTGTGTLYITVGTNPLPVEFTVKSAQGQETVKFSAWGTAVALVAPSAAVTVASLVPSTPA